MILATIVTADIIQINTDKTGTIEVDLLFTSDSIAYVWTGIDDYNSEEIDFITAFSLEDVNYIKLNLLKGNNHYLIKGLKTSVVVSGLLAMKAYKDNGGLLMSALFGAIITPGFGALFSLIYYLTDPKPQRIEPGIDLDSIIKLKKAERLTVKKHGSQIEKIIQQVKPE